MILDLVVYMCLTNLSKEVTIIQRFNRFSKKNNLRKITWRGTLLVTCGKLVIRDSETPVTRSSRKNVIKGIKNQLAWAICGRYADLLKFQIFSQLSLLSVIYFLKIY